MPSSCDQSNEEKAKGDENGVRPCTSSSREHCPEDEKGADGIVECIALALALALSKSSGVGSSSSEPVSSTSMIRPKGHPLPARAGRFFDERAGLMAEVD